MRIDHVRWSVPEDQSIPITHASEIILTRDFAVHGAWFP
jgi:hypothetical protein